MTEALLKYEEWRNQGHPGEFSQWLKQEGSPGPTSPGRARQIRAVPLSVLRIAVALAFAVGSGWLVVAASMDFFRQIESNSIALIVFFLY